MPAISARSFASDSVSRSCPVCPSREAQLHVERRGDGEPLLLIQGMGANSAHWGEPFLARARRATSSSSSTTIAASGAAARSTGDVTTAGARAPTRSRSSTRSAIERAHVFGFSMGGMVAQELALAAPERVATLTLAGTSCGGTQSKPTSAEVVQALTTAVLSGDRERVLKTGFRLLFSSAFAADAANYPPFADGRARPSGDAAARCSTTSPPSSPTTRTGACAAWRAPTLVVHGTEDRMLTPSTATSSRRWSPARGSSCSTASATSLFWEQPERVAQLVREHAAAHAGRSGLAEP